MEMHNIGRSHVQIRGYALYAGKRVPVEHHHALIAQSGIMYSKRFTQVMLPCQMEYVHPVLQPLRKLNHCSCQICQHNFRQGSRSKPKSRRPKTKMFHLCLTELYPC